MAKIRHRRHEQAHALERRKLEQRLHHAGGEHTPGKHEYGLFGMHPPQRCRHQQAQIEKHGGEGRHGIAMMGVEDRTGEGHKRYERKVRKRDAQHVRRQIETRGVREARREHARHERREYHPDNDKQANYQRKIARHGPHEHTQLFAAALAIAHQNRHESLIESALRKQSPEEIRNPEGDEERIRHRRRAEEMRQHDIAHEAAHTREHGHGSDHGALRGNVLRGGFVGCGQAGSLASCFRGRGQPSGRRSPGSRPGWRSAIQSRERLACRRAKAGIGIFLADFFSDFLRPFCNSTHLYQC